MLRQGKQGGVLAFLGVWAFHKSAQIKPRRISLELELRRRQASLEHPQATAVPSQHARRHCLVLGHGAVAISRIKVFVICPRRMGDLPRHLFKIRQLLQFWLSDLRQLLTVH